MEHQVRLYYSHHPDYQINNEQVTNLKNKVSKDNNVTGRSSI